MGTAVIAEWGSTGCPGGTKFQEMYSYTESGQVTKKRLRATRVAGLQERSADLDLAYTYDTAGRLSTIKYPDTYSVQGQAPPLLMPGVKLKQFYNELGQLSRLVEDRGIFNGQPVYFDVVTTAEYNAAGQMTRMVLGAPSNQTETRTYNERLQLSRIDWTGPVWQTYSYQYEYATAPDGSDNNGQVRRAVMSYAQQVGQGWQTVTEQITYQYDTLRRLTSAASTKPWSEAYTYDGFGNRTGAGVPVNAATNRVSTYTHDNNGNVTGMPQMTLEYNVENRLVRATHQTNGIDD